MILRISFFTLIVAALTAGCSKSPDNSTTAASGVPAAGSAAVAVDNRDPKTVVTEFLEAIRTGKSDKAKSLLSKAARENSENTPKQSESTSYEVGDVKMVGTDGAQVSCTWTEQNELGKPHTDKAVWVCRHETEGWRVCGVAVEVFKDEAPLWLNFEDRADMEQRQKWLSEEQVRRARQPLTPTENGKPTVEAEHKPQDAFRR